MSVRDDAKTMKLVAPALAATSLETRNAALAAVAEALRANADAIFAANAQDMQAAAESGVPAPVQKRLRFDEHKLADVLDGIDSLIALPDPLNKVQLHREMDEGLILKRVSCPIGVIGVIFEARPDALVQISTLCLKSGNCAILKGGKETANTNRALFSLIRDAAVGAGLPQGCLVQAESHADVNELLACDREVDLLIPRGSNAFVRYIMDNTRIPVLGHADGICHIYVDGSADLEKAVRVIVDAKTQYTAACNAVETVLVQRSAGEKILPVLATALVDAGVKIRGTAEVADVLAGCWQGYDECAYEVMGEDEFATEYLDLIVSLKLVDGVEEAAEHINQFGSHHTDAILTTDAEAAEYFMQMVDSAGVYVNISTRFADGFRYGFGAEVGISTSKIHARGPVGLEGLVTYKYRIVGDGHIVGDYASGVRRFTHRDL